MAPGADPAELRPLLEEAAQIPRGSASNEKSGRRKEIHRLEIGPTPPRRQVLVKINRYDTGVSGWRRLRGGKARRELRIATGLRERGVATPLPLAAGERRQAGLLVACYLVLPVVEGARDLSALWRSGPSPAQRRATARELGALARRLHDVGLLQEDFAPNNFLVNSGAGTGLLPIDFERARLRATPVHSKARRRMLATLDRHMSGANAATRLRVLTAYAQGNPDDARKWWSRVESVAPRLLRRDFAHLQRTAHASGRRFRPFSAGVDGEWRGWARRDSALLREVEVDLAQPRAGPAERDRTESISVEDRGALWSWSAAGLGKRGSRRAWTAAQVLWMRGEAAPHPVAMLQRGTETRLWFEREPQSHRLADLAGCEAADRAGRALIGRLRALGRLTSDLAPSGIAVCRRGGHWHAQLLDMAAFRPVHPFRPARRACPPLGGDGGKPGV